jgi:DNA-binding CsgD family transcriptional regulator
MMMFVVSAMRGDAVRRDLTALAGAGLGIDEFQAAAADVVRRAVPYDATCWATVDPQTNMLTGSITLHFDPAPDVEARFAETEAAGSDLHSFQQIIGRPSPVARLSDAGRAAISASPRLAEIYRPLGFRHELRAAFTAEGRCWGVAGFLRDAGGSDFRDDEVAFFESSATVIASGIRRAVLAAPASDGPSPGTAVIVIAHDGTVAAATPKARDLLSDPTHAGNRRVGLAVRSVVAAVRLRGVDQASARVRDQSGAWMTVTAAPLEDGRTNRQVVVTMESTSVSDLAALLLTAHGLTRREQEVCCEILAGRSTAEIAAALFISTNTVQDHLKSVFDKVGVRTRRELVAHLAPSRRDSSH